jgi:hypothetical protein
VQIKLLLAALVLSNLAWFAVYRATEDGRQLDITWRHQCEKDVDFYSNLALKMNAEITSCMHKLNACKGSSQ